MTIVSCIFTFTVFSQTFEVSGGYILNHFYDFKKEHPHFRSTYTNGSGYGFTIAIEDLKPDWHLLRFTLGFEKYGGELSVRNSGLGSGSSTQATVDKSILSVGLYPLNFNILKRINLNIGIVISCLIHENFSGTTRAWDISGPTGHNSNDLEERYDKYSSTFYFGFIGRLAYNFKISESIYIFPQYSFYFGVTPEFTETPEYTRSMRHFFAVGIEKRLQKKTKH